MGWWQDLNWMRRCLFWLHESMVDLRTRDDIRLALGLAYGVPRPKSVSWGRVVATVAMICTLAGWSLAIGSVAGAAGVSDFHKIQHIVIIMQENRSFDSYFGTFPRADGIPMNDGVPIVCVPDPQTNECVKPFHDPHDLNHGGPHGAVDAVNDIDGGKMDGFIRQAVAGRRACRSPLALNCGGAAAPSDVMGYHDAREIPNYWA